MRNAATNKIIRSSFTWISHGSRRANARVRLELPLNLGQDRTLVDQVTDCHGLAGAIAKPGMLSVAAEKPVVFTEVPPRGWDFGACAR
jgi:hypothetical protein